MTKDAAGGRVLRLAGLALVTIAWEALAWGLKGLTRDRVLMGTNTPGETFEIEMKKLEMWIENKEHRALVMGGNIARILGLKV